jgi:L-histidine N-alpha-methyltransferase
VLKRAMADKTTRAAKPFGCTMFGAGSFMTQSAVLRLSSREAPVGAFATAVLEGLAARPRVVPARFFYDRAGSELFEAITALPEYYPTRTEAALLAAHAGDIAARIGAGRAVVEFGSGSSAKTPLLLRAVSPAAYVPIDISGEFLQAAAAALADSHPGLAVLPVVADFTRRLALPARVSGQKLLGFFPGSTIGNLTHADAIDLLRTFRATLGADAWFVIGMDTRKDEARLLRAYDDAAGVTAAFNLNLLHRINRELEGSVPVAAFAHEARWNAAQGRIEMHLRALRDVAFSVLGHSYAMRAGETIHTENSYKYTPDEARLMARASGWEEVEMWTDAERLFGVHLWRAAPEGLQP